MTFLYPGKRKNHGLQDKTIAGAVASCSCGTMLEPDPELHSMNICISSAGKGAKRVRILIHESAVPEPIIRMKRRVQVETIYLGDRKLSVRTSVLEEKATACNMLCCYADELKEGFYPYVEQARRWPLS